MKTINKISELHEGEGIRGDLVLFCKKIVEGSEMDIPNTKFKKIKAIVDDGETEMELSVYDTDKNYGKNSNVEKIKSYVGKQFKLCNGFCGVGYLSNGKWGWVRGIIEPIVEEEDVTNEDYVKQVKG